MEFNKVYFDNQLQFYLKEDGQYRVYSPINNMYLDVNRNTYELMISIISLGGLIDFKVLKELFFNRGFMVDKTMISSCIRQLIENRLLFLSEERLLESSETFKKQNEIPRNTTLKNSLFTYN